MINAAVSSLLLKFGTSAMALALLAWLVWKITTSWRSKPAGELTSTNHARQHHLETKPRYSKPRILLVDLPEEWAENLGNAGFAVEQGTFGIPCAVEPSGSFYPIPLDTVRLPNNYAEQEIVIINTGPPAGTRTTTKVSGNGVVTWWQSGARGLIDPRPIAMLTVSQDFDRILTHGGIFIVILSSLESQFYSSGAMRSHRFEVYERIEASNLGFLSELQSIQAGNASGEEFEFLKNDALTDILRRAKNGAHYYCEIVAPSWWQERWIVLATSKYGRPVSGILKGKDKGVILLLPEMPALGDVLVSLLQDWAASVVPGLFPHIEKGRWLHQEEYELPEVLNLTMEVAAIRARADAEIESKLTDIDRLKEEKADYYTLLSGTGRDLCLAVIRTLRQLGFNEVVDVDSQSDPNALREDIQVKDRSPVLVIDVKGVAGHPEDAECQQAEKHALIRSREWKGTDVQALTIINSQRHIPPLDRDQEPFRDEQVKNAEQMSSGLITTVDLAILWRNARKHRWPHSVLMPLLYRMGRIQPIPVHYKPIGTIVKRWKHAFGIIPSTQITIGSRIAFSRVGMDFLELVVSSLRVDDHEVELAPAGSNCGISVPEQLPIRESMQVFLANITEE